MVKYKDPAFLFYPESFLVGVAYMSDEEVGQYIKMMCLQHQKGHIPKRVMEKQAPAVQEKFKQDEKGKYYNERLDDEISKRERFIESRRENGKKGGRPRKEETIGTVAEWVEELLPQDLREPFLEFVTLRESMNSPITSKGTVKRLYEKLKGMSRKEEKQKAIILQSVDKHWKDFYELPQTEKDTKRYKEFTTQEDTDKEYVPMPKGIEERLGKSLGFKKGENK